MGTVFRAVQFCPRVSVGIFDGTEIRGNGIVTTNQWVAVELESLTHREGGGPGVLVMVVVLAPQLLGNRSGGVS